MECPSELQCVHGSLWLCLAVGCGLNAVYLKAMGEHFLEKKHF